MKANGMLLFFLLFAGATATIFGQVQTSGWFDDYNAISWPDEQLRLDNFVVFLMQNKDYKGFVALYRGKKETQKHLRLRSERIRSFLVQKRRVDESRLIFVEKKGLAPAVRTILHPIRKDLPSPEFP